MLILLFSECVFEFGDHSSCIANRHKVLKVVGTCLIRSVNKYTKRKMLPVQAFASCASKGSPGDPLALIRFIRGSTLSSWSVDFFSVQLQARM